MAPRSAGRSCRARWYIEAVIQPLFFGSHGDTRKGRKPTRDERAERASHATFRSFARLREHALPGSDLGQAYVQAERAVVATAVRKRNSRKKMGHEFQARKPSFPPPRLCNARFSAAPHRYRDFGDKVQYESFDFHKEQDLDKLITKLKKIKAYGGV